jgi:predicted dinucleotide-binding enzyme
MTIAIIGSGNVAGALAAGLKKAGHRVLIGARFPLSEKSSRLAAVLGEDAFCTVEAAAAGAEALIITTPAEKVPDLVPQLKDAAGKIIIDATNAIRMRPEPFPTAFHAIKALVGAEHVVKCFNTTGFENMAHPDYQGTGLDMFMAGDSQKAKDLARELALDMGFAACWDFGGDDKVELLEKLALCWINLAIMQGHGRNMAFKILKRD